MGGGGGWVCGKMGWETEGLGDGGGGRRRGWQGEGGLCGTTPCLFLLGWGGWTMWGRGLRHYIGAQSKQLDVLAVCACQLWEHTKDARHIHGQSRHKW